jgi:hypothetical protein
VSGAGGEPNEASTSERSAAASWVRDAEAERRAGRPEQARRLAEAALVEEPFELAGRAVLALACLDLGDAAGARLALEPAVLGFAVGRPEPIALGPATGEAFAVQSDPLADLAENELEHAFANAESGPADVWTTDRVAEAALRDVERGEPEGVSLDDPGSPFATETVAGLLERQGEPARAQAIRRVLEGREDATLAPEERKRWVSTLERWLENLRRDSR